MPRCMESNSLELQILEIGYFIPAKVADGGRKKVEMESLSERMRMRMKENEEEGEVERHY